MKNISICILLFIASLINALEYETFEMKVVNEFNAADYRKAADSDLSINSAPGGGHPEGPALFYASSYLIIADQLKGRNIVLNDKYGFQYIYEKSIFDDYVYIIDNFCIGYNKSDGIVIFDIANDWNLKSQIMIHEIPKFRRFKDMFYYADTLFIVDKDSKLWSIKNPVLDNNENIAKIQGEEDTKDYLNSNEIFEGFEIDTENRFFLKGELKTINIETYFECIGDEVESHSGKQDIIDFMVKNDAVFIGNDNDMNSYWYYNGAILVNNNIGFPVLVFVLKQYELNSTTPTVSPDGDVYLMGYGKDKVILYKIERQW